MALPPREDGPAHHRYQEGDGGERGRGVPQDHPRPAPLPRSLDDPRRALMDLPSLARSPNALAPHYSRFRVAERLLLTDHSHQAWPDVGLAAQEEAWLDAARDVDDKWDAAFAKAERVKEGYAALLGDAGEGIALGASTHELVVRLRSALPLRARPRLVTTDGEFHTIRRQLDRLAEEGLEVVRIAESPVESVAERLAAAVDDRTAIVLVSYVFFDSGRIARGLGAVAKACRTHGAELLVDVYHALNVVPVDLRAEGLLDAFVTGGGRSEEHTSELQSRLHLG